MKRKMMGLLVMLVFVGIMGAMPVMAEDPNTFEKDADGTILIDTVEELTDFAAGINDGTLDVTTNARLTEDIKLNEALNNNPATNWTTWETAPEGIVSWTPIGNYSTDEYHYYAGTFDGNNKTISGVYINAPGSDYTGLFGFCTSPAVIKDLKVTASYLNGKVYTGGIAGILEGTITNCQVEANLVGTDNVGGVAGTVCGTISDCSHHGSVTGISCVGGISGDLFQFKQISNCCNTGSVTGDHGVGGITGYGNNQLFIKNSYNSGDIRGNSYVGGILGYNPGNSIFVNCYYRTGSAIDVTTGTPAYGIGNAADETGKTEAKTAAAFASGEVAYRLNQYDSPNYPAEWLRWTQNPGAATPSLTSVNAEVFDKLITFDYEEDGVVDTYASGYTGSYMLALPIAPPGYCYSYTVGGTTYSQAKMASYQFTAEDGLVFTVKKYQLNFNNEGIVEIDTLEELTEFAKYVNAGNTSANGKLTADIALRDTSNWTAWNATITPTDIDTMPAWTPIGNSVNHYVGTFDGDDHTISGIYINTSGANYQGLFGVCGGSSNINNLKITASYIKGSGNAGGFGAIAGRTDGSITNCQVEANLDGALSTGGVVGSLKGTISGSSYCGSVSGTDDVGGIAGCISGNTSIINCYNTANVAGIRYVGGIVGQLNNGRVENSANIGDIVGDSSVGGVVGISDAGSIVNCYQTGAVTGAGPSTGGILGGDIASNCSNCYYLNGSAVNAGASTLAFGISDTTQDEAGQTAVKTADAFASGEITWLLQAGQTDPTMPVWSQQLDVDELPLLKTTDKIYQVTFQVGNGITAETKAYANLDGNVTLPSPTTGYVWKDANQTVFGAATAVTEDIAVKCGISAPPTAAAAYGTRLGDIAFSNGSVPTENWSWANADKDTVLAVGNTTAYSATYTPSDPAFATETFSITPVITRRSLNAAGVAISLPANSYAYTGAAIEPTVTVTDSGATISKSDYTVAYTSNTSPGTATVTITGQGNYQDEVTRNFTIYSSGGGGYTPPSMWGITVTPQTISFDPTGQLAVDITGAPAGAMVYYSLDGSSYSTTPPAITNAGEHQVFIRITCPGYQDYRTQTTVTVAKQVAPAIPNVSSAISGGQPTGSTDLAALLPADRGQTRYQLGSVDDPGGLLNGAPTIDPNGLISYDFRRPLANQVVTTAADTVASAATITVLVSMENYEDTTITLMVTGTEPEPPAPVIDIRYLTHIQDLGWETDWKTDGALSGTYGQSKRLEALKVELTGELPAGASIETTVHVQNQGDLGPFAMGSAAGTTGRSLRLENICLTLNNLPGYTLLYNVHVQDRGWLRDENDRSSWFRSGEVAGTSALSLRLEGIKIKLVKTEAGGL
ncbi:hypothetical protein GH808_05855 [Acetobacterium fimetarium]|uniref:PEGA domain-containing protein n=1 Tax=Acetobacterium fimetarium TaxID=52691 RepID=A0ABR6WTP8_9FIRM|nr:PEGA domain-containing protein [Acetobacterium fimetarium]MBC3803960.1 hypothetical protein [Acetobacterium fimetarium]